MSATYFAGRIVAAGIVAALSIGTLLGAWADERNGLVRDGSTAEPTARFAMAGDGESLLAEGSDSRLRVTVQGDLATASHVAVLVPGVDTTPERFDAGTAGAVDARGRWWRSTPGWARSLRLAAGELVPGGTDDLAVVAWLGYVTPAAWTGATPGAMRQGAANLAAFEEFLDTARPEADVTWICHSYGSLVCASALVEADPDSLVLLGSPGVGVATAAQLATDATVWAGEGGKDLIGLTELVGLMGGSFGVRPVESGFGARRLPCGAEDGHSDYFRPGSSQVRTMASVATAAVHA
jgi:hypothetical protein